jgi:hypothetical protein
MFVFSIHKPLLLHFLLISTTSYYCIVQNFFFLDYEIKNFPCIFWFGILEGRAFFNEPLHWTRYKNGLFHGWFLLNHVDFYFTDFALCTPSNPQCVLQLSPVSQLERRYASSCRTCQIVSFKLHSNKTSTNDTFIINKKQKYIFL